VLKDEPTRTAISKDEIILLLLINDRRMTILRSVSILNLSIFNLIFVSEESYITLKVVSA